MRKGCIISVMRTTALAAAAAAVASAAATAPVAPRAAVSGSPRRELQTSDETCTATTAGSSTTQYWDIATLSCVDCDAGLVRSADGMYCQCDRTGTSGTPPFCATCPAPSVATQDGTACMNCSSTAGATAPQGSDTDCSCAGDNKVLVEFDGAGNRLAGGKACQDCPAGRYRSPSSAYECLSCATTPDTEGVCECTGTDKINKKLDVYLGECVDEALLSKVPAAVQSKYNSIKFFEVDNGETSDTEVQVLSHTFKQLFWPSVVKCLQLRQAFEVETDVDNRVAGRVRLERMQACQALANLCVLEDYDIDSTESGICELFGIDNDGVLLSGVDKMDGRSSEWKKRMPWLFRDDSVRDDSKEVSLKIGFDPDAEQGIVSRLDFKLAKYALNGTWLGFEELTTQLDVCSNLPIGTRGNGPDYLKIGHGVTKECTVNVSYLLDASKSGEQFFYDLYLVDADGSLVATASKLLNFRENDKRINIDSHLVEDMIGEKFTRRFMLFDRVASVDTAGGQPKIIRYPKLMKLSIKVTELGTPPSIFVPILTIEYGSLDVASLTGGDWTDGEIVTMKFEVEYTKSLESFWTSAVIVFAITSTMAFIDWILRISLFSRNRPSTAAIDMDFMIQVLFEAFGAAAQWTFILLFCVTFYWWFFFKKQSQVHSLLPGYVDRDAFRIMLWIGYLCKVANIAHIIYRQCHVDVFFVDWEKSHGRLIDAAHDDEEDGAGGGAGGSGGGAESKDVYAPVSFWRSLFITNEWAELQTARMVNTELTLLALVFLLRGCKLDNLATAQPDIEDLNGPEDGGSSIDPLLHFFIGSAFIIMLSGGQMIYMKLFHHRYVSNPIEQFLDLLILANLSGVILEGYSGWYLGAAGAPHPHMDTDMHTLAKNLKKEETGKTKPRGLTPSGALAFEIYITSEMRKKYDGLFTQLKSGVRNPSAAAMMQKKERTNPHAPDDSAVVAYGHLNRFFKKFIKTTNPESEFAWKNHTLTSGMRILPLYKPAISSLKKSLFYDDQWLGFKSMLMYGIEADLMTFMCWNFGAFYWLTEHTASSACFTYVAHLLVTAARNFYGMENVAKKTTVDSRFLI